MQNVALCREVRSRLKATVNIFISLIKPVSNGNVKLVLNGENRSEKEQVHSYPHQSKYLTFGTQYSL